MEHCYKFYLLPFKIKKTANIQLLQPRYGLPLASKARLWCILAPKA